MTTLDLTNTDERQILNLARLGLPGARVLGRYRYTHPHPPLPPHRHPRMIEICYLHRGLQRYEIAGSEYELHGGDMLVTLPGELHSTGPDNENRGVLYWLILDVPTAKDRLLGLSPAESRALVQKLLSVPARHFRAPANCRSRLEELFVNATRHDILQNIHCRCHLIEFLLQVGKASRKRCLTGSDGWLEPVLSRMRLGLADNLQVADFAGTAGMSASHFKARFRESTGAGPAEYYLELRIAEAILRIRKTDLPITRIAMDLGFGSSQSFATSFRRITGVSPSQMRTTLRNEQAGSRRQES